MATQWYCRIDGATLGPLAPARLKQLASTGVVQHASLIKPAGADTWLPAAKIRGLFTVEPAGAAAAVRPESAAAVAGRPVARRTSVVLWVCLGAVSAVTLAVTLSVTVALLAGRGRAMGPSHGEFKQARVTQAPAKQDPVTQTATIEPSATAAIATRQAAPRATRTVKMSPELAREYEAHSRFLDRAILQAGNRVIAAEINLGTSRVLGKLAEAGELPTLPQPPADPAQARVLHRQYLDAAQRADIKAMLWVARDFYLGRGAKKDAEVSDTWAGNAVRKDPKTAGILVATLSLQKQLSPEAGDSALATLVSLAERGDPGAKFASQLVYALRVGVVSRGVVQGPLAKPFLQFMRRHASQGDSAARRMLQQRFTPLTRFGWKAVEPKQKEAWMKVLAKAARRAGVEPPVHASVIRYAPTPFYDDARLVEYQVNRPGVVYTVVERHGEAYLLTGNVASLYEINSRFGLKLENRAQVESYLQLYTGALQGPDGVFAVVHDPALLPWRWDVTQEQIDAVDHGFRPISLRGSSDKGYQVEATVRHSTAVFRSQFFVHRDGKVDMTSDEPIATKLPLFIERYREGRRELGPPESASESPTS